MLMRADVVEKLSTPNMASKGHNKMEVVIPKLQAVAPGRLRQFWRCGRASGNPRYTLHR